MHCCVRFCVTAFEGSSGLQYSAQCHVSLDVHADKSAVKPYARDRPCLRLQRQCCGLKHKQHLQHLLLLHSLSQLREETRCLVHKGAAPE